MSGRHASIRLAGAADAPALGRLLYAFNVEFGASTPEADVIAERAAPLIESGDLVVLLVGDAPEGFAQLRFRASIYTGALDAYLEELYVVPALRGRGLGRALLEAAIEHARERGAAHIELGTSEDDVAARTLYESSGSRTARAVRRGRGCSTTSATSSSSWRKHRNPLARIPMRAKTPKGGRLRGRWVGVSHRAAGTREDP